MNGFDLPHAQRALLLTTLMFYKLLAAGPGTQHVVTIWRVGDEATIGKFRKGYLMQSSASFWIPDQRIAVTRACRRNLFSIGLPHNHKAGW